MPALTAWRSLSDVLGLNSILGFRQRVAGAVRLAGTVGVATGILLIASCGSAQPAKDSENVDVRIEFAGPPVTLKLGASVFAEGLIAVSSQGKYALFFPVGKGDAAIWHCAVLDGIPSVAEIGLPSNTPKTEKDRAFSVVGRISGTNSAWTKGGGRDGSEICSLSIAVKTIEKSAPFSEI